MGLAFASLCNETVFYEKEKKCCKLCPRGKFVKNDCTADLETDCRDCPENSFSDSIDRLKECSPCHECQQVFTSKCNQTANAKCSCHPGFLCSNLDCTKCEQKKCSKGEEVKRTGSIEYTYKCVVCPNNTYSDTEEGPCKPLTRCEASGYVPIFPGNKTHNAQCGLHGMVLHVCEYAETIHSKQPYYKCFCCPSRCMWLPTFKGGECGPAHPAN
ncbi:tumor necrosis factor receptor superfamily member 18 isoform X4 [Esox lucius]|uniref:tumor necrosis factor receptor superfamily member 18 isoform X4 n=1 Tax=Esox lucius TaxID=8010 RepID=UPI000661A8FF|nr:tumor necrosis factor receptor superfamily member 18 isoform X4 [Esox lucius]